jgi:hypothetical protein
MVGVVNFWVIETPSGGQHLGYRTQSQATVAQRFDELIGSNPNAQAMKAQFPHVSLAIDDVLETVNRVFEQWRYAYEGEAGSAYGLGELAQAVRQRIVDLASAA